MRHLKLNHLIACAVIPVLSAGAFANTQAKNSTANPQSGNASARAPQTIGYRAVRASELIGTEVRNPQGQNLGEIKDLVVNMNTGDVRYAMLEFDPGIFQGERLFAVPTTQLKMAADRNELVYNMNKERLERASVNRSDWDTVWRDPNYLGNLDKVWGVTHPSQGAKAHRVSDLIGKDVNSRNGDKIGEVEELVVNMANQKVHYAVLGFDPGWASPEQNFAFPLSAFNLSSDRDQLVLDVDKSRVRAMRSYPDSMYSRLNDPVVVTDIDRYLVTITPVGAASTSTSIVNPDAGAAQKDAFVRMDTDKDGALSKTEVSGNQSVSGNWAQYDRDNNGHISRKEFQARR